MQELKYLERANLGGFAIDRRDYLELVEFIRQEGAKKVLEFGPGATTWAFLEAGCDVWSLEFGEEYLAKATEAFREHDKVKFFKVELKHDLVVPEIEGQNFDICLVDSPYGRYYRHFSRLNSSIFAMRVCDTILMHDARRKKERLTLKFIEDSGWKVEPLYRRRSNFTVCRRIENYSIPCV
ncbi:MAG TPA: hypothetical protein VM425_18385 [Myxococcota bacterium]|nr:hypothetical protein [Myxococcota bacterium]